MPQILGREVGPTGLGLMGLSWRPDPVPLEQAIATMKAALEAGCNLWNGGDYYRRPGHPEYNSMSIVKAYFEKYPEDVDKVTLIIKSCVDLDNLRPLGSPENVRKSIDAVLKQLGGVKKLDVVALARRDAQTPLEVTLGVIKKEYIDTGKIGGVALSECRAETIHEASKYVDVAAVEVELSMFSPDILKNGVAAACAEHNIPVVAYSPNGRGLLTGKFTKTSDWASHGIIAHFPRLQEEALQHNLKLVEQIKPLAEKKGCTPSQIALAWIRSTSNRSGLPTIIPIPGTSAPSRAQENGHAVELSEEEFNAINDMVNSFVPSGGRYPDGVPTET